MRPDARSEQNLPSEEIALEQWPSRGYPQTRSVSGAAATGRWDNDRVQSRTRRAELKISKRQQPDREREEKNGGAARPPKDSRWRTEKKSRCAAVGWKEGR